MSVYVSLTLTVSVCLCACAVCACTCVCACVADENKGDMDHDALTLCCPQDFITMMTSKGYGSGTLRHLWLMFKMNTSKDIASRVK